VSDLEALARDTEAATQVMLDLSEFMDDGRREPWVWKRDRIARALAQERQRVILECAKIADEIREEEASDEEDYTARRCEDIRNAILALE